MTNDKGILIQNIYYMLAYAFKVLRQNNYESIAGETDFENIQDLFAAILSKGVAQQVKQGLYRNYISRQESLPVMRGKLSIQGIVRNRIQHKQELACEFDELSENNLLNQILKTTMHYLVRDDGVDQKRKDSLHKVLSYFGNIDILDPSSIPWNLLQYQRNNQSYEMLINVCYFVLKGMLQTTDKGKYRMVSFSDDQMSTLYERFIYEYYKQNFADILKVYPQKGVDWNLIGDHEESMIKFLPSMKTDTMLCLNEKILIIDTKYYGHILQEFHSKKTFHSYNMYQIFTYVKNKDKNNTGNVAGILLYAKTEEDVIPKDCVYNISGNHIVVTTIDLNQNFKSIRKTLNQIVGNYFDIPIDEDIGII